MLFIDTGSVVTFAKESLPFSSLEPAVQNVITRVRFDLLKAYFISVIEKYVF
jgi:nicotinamide riboside kinase